MSRWSEDFARFRRRALVRWVVDTIECRLTPAGRAMLLVATIAAILGNTSLGVPIFIVGVFAATSLVVATALAAYGLPRVRGQRLGIVHGTAHGEIRYEIEVENLGSRPGRDLGVLELDLPAALAPLAPGETVVARLEPGARKSISVRLFANRRGAHVLPRFAVTSSFPLGLVRSLRRIEASSPILVYPAFVTPTELSVPHGVNHQPGGFLLSSRIGESSELMHTREYRAGDNPRHVHWPSTARIGEPVVKVFHEEYFVRLALVIDSEVRSGQSDVAFEAGITHAAGLADWLSRRDYIIDIFAAGTAVYRFQAGRALAHFDHILAILACLDAAAVVDFDALAAELLPEAPRLSGALFVLMDWEPKRARIVAALEATGVSTKVVVVRDAPTTAPPPERGTPWHQLRPAEIRR